MENPEYFRLPTNISPPTHNITLKRSLSDYQTGSRPPLPPKKLGRSPSTEIAKKVSKFEQLAKEGSPPKENNDINKGLWYYKDGLRSPSTPPPRSRSNSLSPSPLANSTSSLPVTVQVSFQLRMSALLNFSATEQRSFWLHTRAFVGLRSIFISKFDIIFASYGAGKFSATEQRSF